MILLPCFFLSNVNNINIHLRLFFCLFFIVIVFVITCTHIFFQTFMTLLNILLKYKTYTSQILSLIISYRLNTSQQPRHRLKGSNQTEHYQYLGILGIQSVPRFNDHPCSRVNCYHDFTP